MFKNNCKLRRLKIGLSGKKLGLNVHLGIVTKMLVNARAKRRNSIPVKNDRTVTVQKIVADINQVSSQRIAEHSVHHTIHCMGY